MSDSNPDSFARRHRGLVALASVAAAVLLTVVFYNATTPKPAGSSAASKPGVAEAPPLQVGALPVT